MKTTRKIVSGIMRTARGTATMLGLAVMLAVVLGVATTANAAAGDPLRLGRLNTVNKLTQLVGSFDGAMLRIDNNSAAAGARALSLEVQPGRAPLTVNATAGKATNLDSDKLDGKDSGAFLSHVYTVERSKDGPGGGKRESVSVNCDPGDKALGGAGGGSSFGGAALENSTLFNDFWAVIIRDDGDPEQLTATVACADFPPLRR